MRATSLALALLLLGCRGAREVQLTSRPLPVEPVAVAQTTQLVVLVEPPQDQRSERTLGHLGGHITGAEIDAWLTHALLDASTDNISFRTENAQGHKTVRCQPVLKKAYVRPESTSVASQVVLLFTTQDGDAAPWEYLSRGGFQGLNFASTEGDIVVPLDNALEEAVAQYRAELAAKYGLEEGAEQRPQVSPSRGRK